MVMLYLIENKIKACLSGMSENYDKNWRKNTHYFAFKKFESQTNYQIKVVIILLVYQ